MAGRRIFTEGTALHKGSPRIGDGGALTESPSFAPRPLLCPPTHRQFSLDDFDLPKLAAFHDPNRVLGSLAGDCGTERSTGSVVADTDNMEVRSSFVHQSNAGNCD